MHGRENGLRILQPLFLGQTRLIQQLRIVVNNRQRRFDLMRYIGNKVSFQRINAAQFLHHLVEIQKQHIQIVQLILTVPGGKVDRKIPRSYLAGSLRKILNRLLIPFSNLIACEDGKGCSYQQPKN